MIVGRLGSLNALEQTTQSSSFWQRFLGAALPSADTLGRVAAQIDLGSVRQVALLGWCAAALKCQARDRWIGWPEVVQWQRLSLVVNNARFLILPGERVRNLASRVLALNLKRLSGDWELAHGHPVWLVETFVAPRRFAGTCYRAAGWLEVGTTRGYGRRAGRYEAHGEPKTV